MSTEPKDKSFYGCTILEEELSKAKERSRKGSMPSLPDMFSILLHNQTMIDNKLKDLLKAQGQGRD